MGRLSNFKFSLPSQLIASHPTEDREEARLMVVHKDTGKIEHKLFKEIWQYFVENDTFIVNETKVFPAKLLGHKERTDAAIEVFLLRVLDPKEHLWDTLVDPARKVRAGNRLYFGNGELVGEILHNTTSRGRTMKFFFEGGLKDFHNTLMDIGTMPLPSQLNRKVEPEDLINYQTVYAKHIGSVVAPAAGLHFTPHLFQYLILKKINVVPITLHLSLDMLKKVDVEDLTKYRSNSEFFSIPNETKLVVDRSLDNKQQVCAVGISTTKAIESAVSVSGRLQAGQGWTNKFCFAPYSFKIFTSLITNFHLPESIPLITTAAFAGYDLLMQAYQIAIKEKYRFFVYGDAMLII